MPKEQRTFLGHPVGLYVLFFTEMWERFSYYGMRALLMLYMVNYFKWEQDRASQIYKIYTSLVYVTPILGGYLADRFLGNRKAVMIGAALMAIGHFLMAFEAYEIFLSALVFLIIGNGFFKPNMSTQVGRLYPPNDPRRDGAYTIFYMGINLGAFFAPLACGWLHEHTQGGFHSGFTMAGIGMVAGLLIYMFGQPLIQEIHGEIPDQPSRQNNSGALSEADAEAQPSAFDNFSGRIPALLGLAGLVVPAALAVALWAVGRLDFTNIAMLIIGVLCLFLMSWICDQVRGGLRDRVVAIVALGLFVIFFWAAFEQAGNVQNLWADKSTNRFLTQAAKPPSVKPEVTEDPERADDAEAPAEVGVLERFAHMFQLKAAPANKEPGKSLEGQINPVPAPWFQSINALAIFVIAPVFAWMWLWLDRRGWQPSIPAKMTLGLLLMSGSMAVMMAAGKQEHKPTSVTFAGPLPAGFELVDEGRLAYRSPKENGAAHSEPFHAGRLTYDAKAQTLHLMGVLPDNERERIVAAAAPKEFVEQVDELKKLSQELKDKQEGASVSVVLDEIPPGFDMSYAGAKKSIVRYDAASKSLIARQELADKEVKGLLVAAGQPEFRAAIDELFVESARHRVSPGWLFWSYMLATLGELCLSPVGLSMVSKLSPARFATMLMGMWMLTSAFGNFAAGAMGEVWGTIPPIQFFLISTVVLAAAAGVLFLLVKKIVASMHGVN